MEKALLSEVAERAMVRTLDEVDGKIISLLVLPFRYQNRPRPEPKSPPYAGRHTDEVLREWLGIDGSKLAELWTSRNLVVQLAVCPH